MGLQRKHALDWAVQNNNNQIWWSHGFLQVDDWQAPRSPLPAPWPGPVGLDAELAGDAYPSRESGPKSIAWAASRWWRQSNPQKELPALMYGLSAMALNTKLPRETSQNNGHCSRMQKGKQKKPIFAELLQKPWERGWERLNKTYWGLGIFTAGKDCPCQKSWTAAATR